MRVIYGYDDDPLRLVAKDNYIRKPLDLRHPDVKRRTLKSFGKRLNGLELLLNTLKECIAEAGASLLLPLTSLC